MRFHAKGALVFLLLCVAAARVGLAQEKQASSNGAYRVTRESPDLQQKPIGSRALTRREGLAILDVVLRSGPGVASYDSPYWKQRGRPHFFRYVKSVPRGARAATPIRTASWKTTALGDTEPHETAAEDAAPDTTETPRVVVLNFVRQKPDQVKAAFLQACNDSEEMLRGRDLFKPAQSLVVFGDFEVKKMHITGNQGWIDVQIDELVSLAEGKVEVHKRSEQQRWTLRRDDNKSWMLTPSRNAIYLPQHTAERILAHRLAQLTEDIPDNTSRNTGGTQEKA